MRFSTVIIALPLAVTAIPADPISTMSSVLSMAVSYSSAAIQASADNVQSAASSAVDAIQASASSAMASLETAASYASKDMKASASEASASSSIVAAQAYAMSSASASLSSVLSSASASRSKAAVAAASASLEAAVIAVSAASAASAAMAEATKKPTHGMIFTCEEENSNKVYGACCEHYKTLMEGQDLMVAPQECKKGAKTTTNGLSTYKCDTQRPFGICCDEKESLKQCGIARRASNSTLFNIEDEIPANLTVTMKKNWTGAMPRIISEMMGFPVGELEGLTVS